MPRLVVTQDIGAPAQQTWDALTDWDAHHRWMLLTRAHGGNAEGATVEAFTGIGRVGFLDPMTITVWEPPRIVVVRHTGRVVRGSGSFEVGEPAPSRSRVIWSEYVDPPLGVLGQVGWPVVSPVLRMFLQASLRRLARYVESGR